ncbi:exonuclease [Synechococcus phage S-CBP1]|uniref:Exonuclease n=1 Tax=Synechococcus phage S-CBP1 TaxID=1273711 RepID=A0A096VKE2_9CAUD|nr:exonuclease [Synechococcus phage S-CBP1]AGK86523.1 exonuclease [Synechococcus phage S-CBP1]
MSLLIDADYIVYKACAGAESEIDFGDDVIVVTSRFSDAYSYVERELYKIAQDLGQFDDSILFFSDSINFRKLLDPAYKGHRNRKKPCGYKRVINKLKEEYHVVVMPTLEADDAIGIYATKEEGHIICSPDKDMRQIPGDLYDLSEGVVTITKEEGDRWHLIQTMAGDQTDGYAGVPTIGVKRADAILTEKGATWQTVLETFLEKGLTEEEALLNARLAKILQVEDYDFTNQTVRPWTPSSGDGAEDGAAIQTPSN